MSLKNKGEVVFSPKHEVMQITFQGDAADTKNQDTKHKDDNNRKNIWDDKSEISGKVSLINKIIGNQLSQILLFEIIMK